MSALEYIRNYSQIKRNFVDSLPKDGLTEVLRGIYEGQIEAYKDIATEIARVQNMLPVNVPPPPPKEQP